MCVTCVQVLVRCLGGQNRSLDPLALAGNCELSYQDVGDLNFGPLEELTSVLNH